MSVKKSYARIVQLGLMYVMVCLLIFLSVGCSEEKATLLAPPKPATITFACNQSDEAYYEEMVQKFNEQYPHITVNLHHYQRDSESQITADDADVLISRGYFLRNLYTQGDIMDLQPLIEGGQIPDLADFHPGAMASLSGQGSTWAIPAGVDLTVMYYNKNLFDQYSVPYPEIDWTLDDFLNAAMMLRDPDTGVYGYTSVGNAADPASRYWDAYIFIHLYGGQLFDDFEPTRPTFDDPLVVEALEWYARLYHEYNVALTAEEAWRNAGGPFQYAFHSNLAFGKIGMWMLPFSERGGTYWPSEWSMDWGVTPLPHSKQSAVMLWAEGYAISSKTPSPEAGWQWITFLSKEMPYRLIPARQLLLESADYEKQIGSDYAAIARASMDRAIYVPEISDEIAGIFDLFGEEVNGIVSDDLSPQKAMDRVQREARARIGP